MYRSLLSLCRAAMLALAPALAAATLILAPLSARAEGRAHAHGVATLEVAIDATHIQIDLETPLDNLVGFERAPRSEAEKRRVQAALERLRDAERMFAIDPAAQCRATDVSIESAVLGLSTGPAGHPAPEGTSHEAHAELDASYTFECAHAAKTGFIDIGLFEFKGFGRLDVQVVTPKAQLKRSLRRNAARLTLSR